MKERRSICIASARHLVSGVAVLLGTCVGAEAQDLEALSRLLIPAYTAMSYAGLCSVEQDWAVAQPCGPRGAAINYAQHEKDEVIASLAEADAVTVLKMAADAARTDARAQLRDNVIVPDKTVEALRFRDWCNGYVNGFITDLIRKYDGDHVSFMHDVELAKSPHASEGAR
jgi:hypothetical protein